ncbi:hypothetical protein FACS189425_03230 [Clostridia bacterium]|nr:hypothetical protein FACS189425_03230 [Clostridia bacterium]
MIAVCAIMFAGDAYVAVYNRTDASAEHAAFEAARALVTERVPEGDAVVVSGSPMYSGVAYPRKVLELVGSADDLRDAVAAAERYGISPKWIVAPEGAQPMFDAEFVGVAGGAALWRVGGKGVNPQAVRTKVPTQTARPQPFFPL